jgi:hypothetical protein
MDEMEEDLARSQDQLAYEELVTNILEEEDDVVACHRQQIEDNMALVQEEMGLLTQVEMPGGSVEVLPPPPSPPPLPPPPPLRSAS